MILALSFISARPVPQLTVASEPDLFTTASRPVSVVHFPPVILSHYDGTLFSAACAPQGDLLSALHCRCFLCASRVAPKDPSGAWVRVLPSLCM
jgi:hypothetical protein